MERKISIKVSGVPSDSYRYSGKMSCNYLYVTSLSNYAFTNKKENYDYFFFENFDISTHPIILNYTDTTATIYEVDDRYLGLFYTSSSVSSGTQGSFYRRQYDKYKKKYWDSESHSFKIENHEFIGPWEPVAISVQTGLFRDFNIKSGHSYQYIMYPSYATQKQTFAKDRAKKDIYVNVSPSSTEGDAIHVSWNEWSITELIEEDNVVNAPILKKTYKADLDNIWFFKYDLDVGSQKQNVIKTQVNTLGKFPRIAQGNQDYISGSVTCLLGSEIVPYSNDGYIERMWNSIKTPLSTNEKIYMLKKWRSFVYSKNPKLLKDMKGQSWIVSILDNSNTPYNSYRNQPDKISFSWVELEDTQSVIIYGDGKEVVRCGGAASIWESTTK